MLCGVVRDEIYVSYRVEMFGGKSVCGAATDLRMT